MNSPTHRRILSVMAVLAAVQAAAYAQIPAGARIRMRLDSPTPGSASSVDLQPSAWQVGELVAELPDTIQVRFPGDTAVRISWWHVNALEVSDGYHSNVAGGAVAGGMIGGGLGLLIGSLDSCSNESSSIACVSGGSMVGIAVVSALVGGILGAAVGSPERERWRRVVHQFAVRPAIRASPSSVGMGLAIAW